MSIYLTVQCVLLNFIAVKMKIKTIRIQRLKDILVFSYFHITTNFAHTTNNTENIIFI